MHLAPKFRKPEKTFSFVVEFFISLHKSSIFMRFVFYFLIELFLLMGNEIHSVSTFTNVVSDSHCHPFPLSVMI